MDRGIRRAGGFEVLDAAHYGSKEGDGIVRHFYTFRMKKIG
ncbi:MAG: hypothetical protein V3W31_06005 [Thermodesulfobacteriota bacterium]